MTFLWTYVSKQAIAYYNYSQSAHVWMDVCPHTSDWREYVWLLLLVRVLTQKLLRRVEFTVAALKSAAFVM